MIETAVVAARAAWIQRVLGVSLDAPVALDASRAAWAAAGPAASPNSGAVTDMTSSNRSESAEVTPVAIPLVRTWTDAKEAVDQQLNGLYAMLRKAGVPALGEIAGEIEAVLGTFRVGLTRALMDYDQAAGPEKNAARAAALAAIDDYKTRIPADKHVIAADTNPFGVRVTARETLGAALLTLGRQLESV